MSPELVLSIISAVLFLLAARLWFIGESIISNEEATIANKKNAEKQKDIYKTYGYPAAFIPKNGKPLEQEYSVKIDPPSEKVKQVDSIYDPNDPTKLRFSFTFLYELLPVFIGSMGLLGLIVSIFEYLEIVDWF